MQQLKKILKKILPKQTIHWLNKKKENAHYRMWRIIWAFREKILSMEKYEDPYGSNEIFWINPKRIRYRTFGEFNYYRDHNKIIGGDWDVPLQSFEENEFYQAYYYISREGRSWPETQYYKRYLKDIMSGKERWGCKTKEDWDQRCIQLDKMCHDIKKGGYQSQKIEDYISVNISRIGQLLFNDGRHRLTFSKLLQINQIPIRITVRHLKWIMFKKHIFAYANKRENRGGKVYAPLTHIDLQTVPSGYGNKRFELIQKNITAASNGTLLDLGSHWGYFCHRFEDLGYNCIAVENDKENLYFLEILRKAEDRNFTVFNKSLFSLDLNMIEYDIVLALAIFHHLTKEEKTYNQLVNFLKNLRTREMFFEPPDPAEPQMQTAFRNFNSKEFVEFIISNSALKHYKKIGEAEDRRELYKIWL